MPPFQRSPTSSPGRRGADGAGAAPFACVESNNTKSEIEAHHSKPLQLNVKTPPASPPPDHPSVSSSSLSSSSTTSSSSSSPPHHQDDYYYVTRNALDNFDGSIHAVLECLSRAGVSQASLNELSTDFTQGNYVHVMQHAHDYATCIYGENIRGTNHRDHHHSGAQGKSIPDSKQENDDGMMIQQQLQEQEERAAEASVLCFLLLSSWEALHRYLAMQHRQAHRHYFMLRRCQSSQQHDSFPTGASTLASSAPLVGHHVPQQPLSSSLTQKVSYAPAPAVSEQAASRLRSVVANLRARKQQQQHKEQLSGTSSQSHATAQSRGTASAGFAAVMHGCVTQTEVNQALKRKLELAESCCTSQKGLLKAQAWQRRLRLDSEQQK